MTGPLRTAADRVAGVGGLPTALRAVLSHYARGGRLELDALRVQRRVEDRVDAIVAEAYEDVEGAIAAEFDRDEVSFDYDTKLTMPVELTLGHVYRRALAAAPPGVDPIEGVRKTDPLTGLRRRFADAPDTSEVVAEVARADHMAELVVEALLDGDMRDAINDDEYEDFEVDFAVDEDERARVAEIAQSALQDSVEARFAAVDDAVRAAYDDAVERSEAHQDRDPHFRELMAAAEAGDDGAVDRLRAEYKFAEFDADPDVFTQAERELPYLRTQYGRVGVIYDGMVEMFREGGVALDRSFKRAVVLAIIGAQVWLDDVDDFPADMAEGQLTPVTAEYLLADDAGDAYDAVCALSDRYLDRAHDEAAVSDSPITGIAVEYIRRSGDPSVLPR